MVGIVVDELKLAAPGIEIGFTLDVSRGVGNDRSGFEMIREIVKNAIGALAGDALAIEEHIFVGQVSA